MVLILGIPFILAFALLFIYPFKPKTVGVISICLLIALFLYFFSFVPSIVAGQDFIRVLHWIPQLGLDVRLRLDGLSLFFTLLISFFGTLILGYSMAYMREKKHQNRFLFFLLLFMGAMLGVVLSDNIFLLYVFWEATSISSYLLISFNNHAKSSRRAALQALLVTNIGGLCLLAGLLLLGNDIGSYQFSAILQTDPEAFKSSEVSTVLILIGCFTKSAQFPFHFWLPNAMEAPTPVSAFLHSATMVKAGIYLVMRLNPLMGGDSFWMYSLLLVGSTTMLVGSIKVFLYHDLKKILAYLTISALGMMTAIVAVNTALAMQAAILYLLVHALYKGSLFLAVGNIDHRLHRRDIRRISGLFSFMPYTGVATLLSCLSMAGLPPFLGFIAKEKMYEASLAYPIFGVWLTVCIGISSAVYFAMATKFAYGLFIRNRTAGVVSRDCPIQMWLAPLLLGVLGLFFGVFGFLSSPFLDAVSRSLLFSNTEQRMDWQLWHGFNTVFLLSVLTWLIGVLLSINYNWIKVRLIAGFKRRRFTVEHFFFYLATKFQKMALYITQFLQNGYLTRYLMVIFGLLLLLLLSVCIKSGFVPPSSIFKQEPGLDRLYEYFPMLLITIGVITIIKSFSRLMTLVALSLIGYGIALFYAIYSAPDVSMTQFLVETMTLVIFTIVLNRLPKNVSFPKGKRNNLTGIISISFGLIITFILMNLQAYDIDATVKNYYLEHSESLGHSKNVVNVLLVNFRSFDTFGETVVLCMTALGVMNLIRLKLIKEKNENNHSTGSN